MKKRITTYITLIVTIPIIIFISVFSSIMSIIILNQKLENLELATQNLVEYIESTYREQLNGTESFIESPEIISFLQDPNDQSKLREAEIALFKVFSYSESNSTLTILNPEGEILITTENNLENKTFLQGDRFPLFQITRITGDKHTRVFFERGIPILDIAFPIFVNKKLVGILSRETPLPYIETYAKNLNKSQQTIYIFTNTGTGIRYAAGKGYMTRAITVFAGGAANNKKIEELQLRLNDSKTLTGKISYALNDLDSIGTYSKIPDLDLVCLVSQRRAYIYYDLNLFQFIVLLGSLLFIFILSFFISRYFTVLVSPIADYNEKIRSFLSGNSKARCSESGFNFVGQLGNNINDLFDEVNKNKTYEDELETELNALLTVDQITNLLNNRALYNVIDEFIDKDDNQALIMFDTGIYDEISNNFGNSVSNRLLEIISSYIGDLDEAFYYPARIAKDKFCIYISHFNNEEEIEKKGRHLLNRLNTIKRIDDLQVNLDPHVVIIYKDKTILGRSDWLRVGFSGLKKTEDNNENFTIIDISDENTDKNLIENIIFDDLTATQGFSKSSRLKNKPE